LLNPTAGLYITGIEHVESKSIQGVALMKLVFHPETDMSQAMADVGKSLVAATSSSRYTDLNFWRDPRSGNGFQIQVEIPQFKMASLEDVADLPVMPRNA